MLLARLTAGPRVCRRRSPASGFLRSAAATALALCALGGALACGGSAWPPPPETRVENVTDTLHGVALVDPYRWLEDEQSPEVRAWIAAQNAYADSILRESPLRARFAARLGELMDRTDVSEPRRAGDWEYFTMQRAGEEVASVYRRRKTDGPPVRPDPAGHYEKILDPLALDPTGTTSLAIQGISADGRFLLYSVRDGGPDEIEVRVFDVEHRTDLPDVLPTALYGGLSFEDGARAIRYVHRSREAGPRLKRHRMGTPIERDSVLWGDGLAPTSFLTARDGMDGRWQLYTVQHGWATTDMYLQDLRANGPVVPIAKDLPARFNPQFVGNRLLVLTNLDAPRNRIVEIDPSAPGPPESWRTVLPEGEHVIDGFTRIGDRFYVTIIDTVAHRILRYTDTFQPDGEIEVPPHSSASVRGGPGNTLLLTISSFTQPSITYRIDPATGSREVRDPPEVAFDATGMVVRQVWYTSKDGTRAPMYVVHRDDIELDGTRPALLTGYGGFNVSQMPRFDTRGIAWIEEGGVFALATLRGGGEFGEEWHRAGMLENKQNVFDDFTSAADWLVANGYTSPEHLTIRGGSNGGLLMGAAITQRPELFRAAFIGVPDVDMVRFYRYTQDNNLPALLEYGDASRPDHFPFLRAHSPYENVRPGTRYPAVLVHTGDNDTRVPPAQARKLTAKLQAMTRSGLPVILHYDARMGHAGGRPRSHVIADAAAELAFLMTMAGYPDGANVAAVAGR